MDAAAAHSDNEEHQDVAANSTAANNNTSATVSESEEAMSSKDSTSSKSFSDGGNETKRTEDPTGGTTSSPKLAAAVAPAVAPSPSYEMIHKGGGRIRLPDKLMEYLSKEVLPDTIWWQPDGDGFAFDTDKIQTKFLDQHFRGTKLTSFIRSLNRWYVTKQAFWNIYIWILSYSSVN